MMRCMNHVLRGHIYINYIYNCIIVYICILDYQVLNFFKRFSQQTQLTVAEVPFSCCQVKLLRLGRARDFGCTDWRDCIVV